MAIELVDGHAGKPHISGDDLGDFKAGILGNDGYVFNRANKLAATLNGSNSVTIATGSGILPVSGRHFRVTSPETLTITSGTQGQNRNDLCVVRASTSSDGTTVENVQLLILRGTPTSGSASDPATQEGDLVLYRFQLTGVSVAEPIALFDVMVPYNEFRDSISQTNKSGWNIVQIGKTLLQWTEIEATYANTNVLISSVINVPTRVLNGVAIGIIGANGNVKKALDWIPGAERITSGDYTTGIECSVHSPSGTFTSTTKQTMGVLLIGTID